MEWPYWQKLPKTFEYYQLGSYLLCFVKEILYFVKYNFDIIPSMSRPKTVRVQTLTEFLKNTIQVDDKEKKGFDFWGSLKEVFDLFMS